MQVGCSLFTLRLSLFAKPFWIVIPSGVRASAARRDDRMQSRDLRFVGAARSFETNRRSLHSPRLFQE